MLQDCKIARERKYKNDTKILTITARKTKEMGWKFWKLTTNDD